MRTDGQTLRANQMVNPNLDLESVKEWARRAFTKETIAGVVVSASTVTVLGTLLFALHRAMENQTIVGF